MVVVEKLSAKVQSVKTVSEISMCFNNSILNLMKDFDEVIVVFDTYRDSSLKNRTRQKRRKGNDHVQYQVLD